MTIITWVMTAVIFQSFLSQRLLGSRPEHFSIGDYLHMRVCVCVSGCVCLCVCVCVRVRVRPYQYHAVEDPFQSPLLPGGGVRRHAAPALHSC